MHCTGAMGCLTLNGGIGTDRADLGMFASSAHAESPLKKLHSRSSRSVRRALHATGAAIGHSVGDDVPTLKRARSSASGGGGPSKTMDLTDDDQLSNASSLSRKHHHHHHITYGK